MQFIIASALLAVAAAAPIASQDSNLQARDRLHCVITGYEADTISSNAPASGVAGTSVKAGLSIKCDGDDKPRYDSNNMPNSQTVKAGDAKFPKDVHWTQDWQVGGYKSCSVSYGDGNPTVDGKVGPNNIDQAIGASSTSSNTCSAEFFVDM